MSLVPAVPRILALLTAALVLTACGADDTAGGGGATGDGSVAEGGRTDVGGSEALRWGDGPRGVVLAHGAAFDAASWAPQATRIAASGFTVVALEDIAPAAIADAARALTEEGIEEVVLLGGSAGADAILQLATDQPDLPSQLILLSPNGFVDGLGEEPKLFIASEEEPVAEVSTQLADAGPGPDNQAVLLPGSAHAQNIFTSDQGERVMELILDRLSATR